IPRLVIAYLLKQVLRFRDLVRIHTGNHIAGPDAGFLRSAAFRYFSYRNAGGFLFLCDHTQQGPAATDHIIPVVEELEAAAGAVKGKGIPIPGNNPAAVHRKVAVLIVLQLFTVYPYFSVPDLDGYFAILVVFPFNDDLVVLAQFVTFTGAVLCLCSRSDDKSAAGKTCQGQHLE